MAPVELTAAMIRSSLRAALDLVCDKHAAEVDKLRSERDAARTEINAARAEIDAVHAELTATRSERDAARAELDAVRAASRDAKVPPRTIEPERLDDDTADIMRDAALHAREDPKVSEAGDEQLALAQRFGLPVGWRRYKLGDTHHFFSSPSGAIVKGIASARALALCDASAERSLVEVQQAEAQRQGFPEGRAVFYKKVGSPTVARLPSGDLILDETRALDRAASSLLLVAAQPSRGVGVHEDSEELDDEINSTSGDSDTSKDGEELCGGISVARVAAVARVVAPPDDVDADEASGGSAANDERRAAAQKYGLPAGWCGFKFGLYYRYFTSPSGVIVCGVAAAQALAQRGDAREDRRHVEAQSAEARLRGFPPGWLVLVNTSSAGTVVRSPCGALITGVAKARAALGGAVAVEPRVPWSPRPAPTPPSAVTAPDVSPDQANDERLAAAQKFGLKVGWRGFKLSHNNFFTSKSGAITYGVAAARALSLRDDASEDRCLFETQSAEARLRGFPVGWLVLINKKSSVGTVVRSPSGDLFTGLAKARAALRGAVALPEPRGATLGGSVTTPRPRVDLGDAHSAGAVASKRRRLETPSADAASSGELDRRLPRDSEEAASERPPQPLLALWIGDAVEAQRRKGAVSSTQCTGRVARCHADGTAQRPRISQVFSRVSRCVAIVYTSIHLAVSLKPIPWAHAHRPRRAVRLRLSRGARPAGTRAREGAADAARVLRSARD